MNKNETKHSTLLEVDDLYDGLVILAYHRILGIFQLHPKLLRLLRNPIIVDLNVNGCVLLTYSMNSCVMYGMYKFMCNVWNV